MPSIEVEIVNKLGLHARPSAKLTQAASRFQSEIWLTKAGRKVNGKSIMGVMMLAAAKGSKLQIQADGPDADEALLVLQGLIASGFGES
ncbi:MAG: HPr family phosphocarrier protein [Burkholderiaceae bacterium]